MAAVTVTAVPKPDVEFAGRIFDDRDNDGVFNGSDAGIAGISVQLFSESNLTAPLATATTKADGRYLFDLVLGEGDYRIVAAQPAGLLDGKETVGALGGTVHNATDSDTIEGIVVSSSVGDVLADGYNFAEIRPSRLQGLVWEDANNNGEVDFGERAIAGVEVRLTGIDDRGAAVDRLMQTDSQGIFEFLDLRPSNAGGYTLAEAQPLGFLDGLDAAGTVNGAPSGTSAVNDVFSEIGMAQPGSNGINYNFGEVPAVSSPVQAGQTATIGFWHNKNGQALIRSLNAGPDATQLANWLAASFPNLYGATAGSNNLAGMTNVEVADFYRTLFKRNGKTAAGSGPPKVDAQVLAVALAAYVTNQNLAGAAAISYGFAVDSFGVGAAAFNVADNGEAFGVAGGSTVRILDLLLAVNFRTKNGLLYDLNGDGDTSDPNEELFRTMVNDVFSDINEAGDL